MDAPPEHESVEIFARVAGHFKALGLNVPLVFALDKRAGFALLSDLGTRTYLGEIEGENADRLYGAALNALHRLQTGSRGRLDVFEPYDNGKLMREMELFRQWFVPCRTSNRLSARDQGTINGTFNALAATALEQPRVWVHRDFHSRNLMVTEVENPGILDFQDAVTGPLTYDLVSLLRDCYIAWPTERVSRWLSVYFDRIRDDPLVAGVSFEQFVLWFDWMGIQRHIKVLGIFSRLFHRDGKAEYLDDLPLVYKYVCEACDRYSELRPFKKLLESMDVQWTS
jgi:aminoglycoside/choline kinase family phosphotransferase